jgi:hypothetical protein
MPNSIAVTLHWNAYIERWVIQDILGRNCYEMPDCGWFRQLFGDLDKESKHTVVVRTEAKEQLTKEA